MLPPLVTKFAAACSSSPLLGFPTWYKYLNCITDDQGKAVPHITGLSDVWLILAAIIDILLRLSALVAIGFVVYGGVLYITSRGDTGAPGRPGRTTIARQTIINALVGLVISVSAAAMVGFIAGRFN